MSFTAHVPTEAELWTDELAANLFYPGDVPGIAGHTGLYEGVVEALTALISRIRPSGAEVMRFPSVMSRALLEKQGYLHSSPSPIGCVGALPESGGSAFAADLVLTPSASYPVYSLVAKRGPARAGGVVVDVACECFRLERSDDIDRHQSFRMREFVCIGTPLEVHRFREEWMIRSKQVADTLGLSYRIDRASDPFVGRGGQIVAISQIQQSLKFELLVPVRSDTKLTACMGFNYHRDHFGRIWDIQTPDGAVAHTGSVAFGIDRLALALFAAHGLDTAQWPAAARETLRI